MRKFLTLLLGISFLFAYFFRHTPLTDYLLKPSRINILILGISEFDFTKHAETIIWASYCPKTRFLDLLSIPRDTLVKKGRRRYKLSDIYARAWKKERDKRSAATVLSRHIKDILSVEIPFYIQINYKAFIELVDAVGGIEVEIEKGMDYDDYAGNLHIHFVPGMQKLHGKEALRFLRFRHDPLGDWGRIARQQYFLKKLIEKMTNVKFFEKTPFILREVLPLFSTNLTWQDIILLIFEMRGLRQEHIRMQSLSGSPEIFREKDFWVLDQEKKEDVIHAILDSDLLYQKKAVGLRPGNVSGKILVEIWNATDRKDLAYHLTRRLRKKGLDVVRWGNYGVYKRYTMVIDRTGEFSPAQKVAKLIGCQKIKSEIDNTRLVNVSLVIGEDFVYEEK